MSKSEVKTSVYYCPASDSLHEVIFFTETLAVYSDPISGEAFIHIDTLNNNMIFLGEL